MCGPEAAPATPLRAPRARVDAWIRNPTVTQEFQRTLGSRVRGGRGAVAAGLAGRVPGAPEPGLWRTDALTVIFGGGGGRGSPEVGGL